jgi:hypothetical protein
MPRIFIASIVLVLSTGVRVMRLTCLSTAPKLDCRHSGR